jgi:hypothetical protein
MSGFASNDLRKKKENGNKDFSYQNKYFSVMNWKFCSDQIKNTLS